MKRTKVMNPILTGFHPDPSILRVQDDYYIANSTFEYFPGVEIHHSKDLVNWEFASRPLTTDIHLDMKGNPKSGGIWAPCLTYDKGIFYLIFTDVKQCHMNPFKDVHNYVTTATSIEGPWSKPVYLNSSGFDPSLFHDDDKKWYVNMEWDHRKEGISPKFSGILLQEYDEVSKKLVGPVQKIFTGSTKGLVEGPHLMKRGEYYYLLTAEGGTSYEHAITVARSKKVEGPYEMHPNKHLITSMGKEEIYLQRAGHGSLVETPNGKWYVAFLCGRPLPDTKNCILGRETAIQEIKWKDDWPYLVNGSMYPDAYYYVDGDIKKQEKVEKIVYDFSKDIYLHDFQTLRIPMEESVYLHKEKWLGIRGLESILSEHRQAMLLRRQQDFIFEAFVEMKATPESFQHMSGLSYRYDEENQYYFFMAYDEEVKMNRLQIVKMKDREYSYIENEDVLFRQNQVFLKVKVDGKEGQFLYSFTGKEYKTIGPRFETYFLSDEFTNPEGFTGAFVGFGAQDLVKQEKVAYFRNFTYISMERR